ncbi:hypothetical protein KC640_01130, partial [Candidatus Dojkabacteria bacterium]|nr:hypothetical protein [Candidatus Dojkabacteria bacterium]
YNEKLINQTQDTFAPFAPDIQVAEGIDLEVVSQTVWEKLGLNFVEQIPERQRYLYALYGALLLIVVLILITLYLIYKPRRKREGEMTMEEYNKQFGVAS